jgi:hypothetical protein
MARLAAVTALLLARGAAADDSYTEGGCLCLGSCARTIDSLTDPWCAVSPSPVEQSYNNTCLTAKYSQSRSEFWDFCTPNVTSNETPGPTLTTLGGMWSVITASTTTAVAAVYGLAGCAAASLTSTRRAFLWLPLLALLYGAAESFFVGSVFALIVSFLYLSIPWALDLQTAIALGFGLAALLVYTGLGRHYQSTPPPHPAEYAE